MCGSILEVDDGPGGAVLDGDAAFIEMRGGERGVEDGGQCVKKRCSTIVVNSLRIRTSSVEAIGSALYLCIPNP